MILLTSCGGSAIGNAQDFVPNEPPAILSIKAVNLDGSDITQLDIEPYKQFKLIVQAIDPDNNPLEYKFDSESGTFAGIVKNSSGCTAIFKTGSIKGGQNIDLWAGVSDGNGALVRQSYNLGTGKLGPAITAVLEKIRFRPTDSIKLSVSANCSGFFQLYTNGSENFDFEKDMFRYSYGPNKTTDFILAGPKCSTYADIYLDSKAVYDNNTSYQLVLVFRDGLFQTNSFKQAIFVDEEKPSVTGFTPNGNEVSLNAEVTVTFEEALGYADSSCLKLEPAHGSVKLLNINDGKAVFYVSGLRAFKVYTAKVSGIKDIAGNEMEEYSAEPFTTKKQDFAVAYDDKPNYTAYRGFEDSTITLVPTFNGDPVSGVTYEYSSNYIVINGNNLSVKTKSLAGKTDETKDTVVVTAGYQNFSAVFTVIIEPWYIVTKANEFGDGAIIDKNLSGRFKLGNIINFNANITPIGTSDNPFEGVFDGQNNTLLGLTITSSAGYAGLFAANKGTIKNLSVSGGNFDDINASTVGIICGHNDGAGEIKNCHVESSSILANSRIGGITGSNNGLIDSCTVNGGSITAVNGVVGGIVGYNVGTVKNTLSISLSNTEVSGDNQVGGFVGNWSGGQIGSGCNSTGKVTGSENVGGFAGLINFQYPPALKDLYSSSEVNGTTSGRYIGGFAGYAFNLNISNCFSTGKVIAADSENVGGFIGHLNSSGKLTGCYHVNGAVQGKSNVGGLIGYIFASGENSVQITGSYAKFTLGSNNDVIGQHEVGGLIGYVYDYSNSDTGFFAIRCYAAGEIYLGTETSNNNAGGLIGYYYRRGSPGKVPISECFASGKVTAYENAGGLIGLTEYCKIANSYSNAEVVATKNVGGLVGYIQTTSYIDYCYAVGTIANSNSSFGGLVGKDNVNSPISKSFRKTGNGYPQNTYGEDKSEIDLKKIETYTTNMTAPVWTITSDPSVSGNDYVWIIKTKNGGYPYLANNQPE